MRILIGPKHRAASIEKADAVAAELRLIDGVVAAVAQRQGSTVKENMLRKYIVLQRTDGVAAWLDENGHRMGPGNSGRKYLHTDVTAEIRSREKDECVKLRSLARTIYDYNKGKAGWPALVRAFRNYG